MSPNHLLQLVRKKVVAHYGEAWFLRRWAWPNPDAGHLRLKLPAAPGSGPRRIVDLRIRLAAEWWDSTQAVPQNHIPEVACIASWLFDGAEQVALADFWVLVREDMVNHSPICLVLPTLVLLDCLRRSTEAGRLYLYVTASGDCYASPSLQTPLTSLRRVHGPRTWSSSFSLTSYVNAWQELGR